MLLDGPLTDTHIFNRVSCCQAYERAGDLHALHPSTPMPGFHLPLLAAPVVSKS